jgi:CO/xanthine dehydrogenase Mo-binding subunit
VRQDGRVKIRGEATYVTDLEVAGLLASAILRSPHPHARIERIDVSRAEAMPGVVAVLTQGDLVRPGFEPYYGHIHRDRPVLADGVVRFAGEPVAAVAAIDEETAQAALLAIEVDYAPLPSAADVEVALQADAPHVQDVRRRPEIADDEGRPAHENVCHRYRYTSGDADDHFARAAVVVEGTYRFPSVYQYAMEPHATIAHWTATGVDIWSNCQHPFLVRAEIADMFGLPLGGVRIVVPYVGGGFGSKSYTRLEPLAVALAHKARRPVRVVNDIEGAMLTSRRHNMVCSMRTAADSEGRLLARQVRIRLDTGAYADNGPTVAESAGVAASGPYHWEALDMESLCVFTHRSPSGSYRGFGNGHLTWIGESQIDDIARRLGQDRLSIRVRNLVGRGDHLYPHLKPIDADLAGDLIAVASALGLDEPTGPYEGKGIGIGLGRGGAQTVSGALVRLDSEGNATVLVGSTEIGQGTRTVHAQIAAEVLELPLDKVTVLGTDTAFTPFDRSTGASRSTTIAGLAVQRAAQDVLEQLRAVAGEDQLTHAETVRRATGISAGELVGRGSVTSGDFEWSPAFWEVGAAGAHVAVDPDTGQVRLLKVVTLADVGRAINPQLVERQDEGCSAQAIGNTLFEELDFDETGVLLNASLLEYRVPTTQDVPDEAHCIIVENGDGPGPFGAKGCGEGVFGGLPAAIVNALADAGAVIDQLPATPERVWRALNQGRS